jgi:hypothetical protein
VTDKELEMMMNPLINYSVYTREYEKPTKNFNPSNKNYAGNPHGLYYACGSSWIHMLNRGLMEERGVCCYLYAVSFSSDARIFHAKTLKELYDFSLKYGDIIKLYKTDGIMKIRWKELFDEGYDGFEYCSDEKFDMLVSRRPETKNFSNYTLWAKDFFIGADGGQKSGVGVVWNVDKLDHKLVAVKDKNKNEWIIHHPEYFMSK